MQKSLVCLGQLSALAVFTANQGDLEVIVGIIRSPVRAIALPDKERGPLRKRGKAKNKRYDAPLISVGLAVPHDGLPVRSWVFPGNTTDVTVERVKADLKGWKLGRCVFVGDAGMNSEENRHTLSLANGKYILAAKMRGGDEVTKQVMTRAVRYHEVRDNLRVKESSSAMASAGGGT